MNQKKHAIQHSGTPTDRWELWLGWLQDERMAPRKRLLEALLHASLPDQLLHQFACDCAVRSLHLASASGVLPPPILSATIDAKRRWIEGSDNAVELDNLTREVVAWGSPKSHRLQRECALSVEWAAAQEPVAAARYASLHVQMESEYAWQCQRLTQMLRSLLAQRTELLRQLRHRQLTLSGALTTFGQQLEDALY